MEMSFTTLGRTDLRVSRVGLGAGGPSRLGRARGASQVDVERVIHRALDLGVNFIDTAAGYGTEPAIGAALQSLGAQDVMVATKAGVVRAGEMMSPTQLQAAVDGSLRDLRRTVLDVFQFHAVEPGDLDGVVTELLPVAERLREQGKIRFVGITENPSTDVDQQMAAQACESGLWDTVMVQYGVFDQLATRRTLPAALRHGTGTLCMSAARAALVNEEMLTQVLERLDAGDPEEMRFLLTGASHTWADLAFRFAAACDGIDMVLVGTGNADHFEASARAILAPPLPKEQLHWLTERFGATTGKVLWEGEN
ncbi:MAG TPA: hypothetical protein DIC52_24140 [Candidatus Latescibacteria bacterium]|nr:hypothetical protein [Candidatus Latescibacterota bacterium]